MAQTLWLAWRIECDKNARSHGDKEKDEEEKKEEFQTLWGISRNIAL